MRNGTERKSSVDRTRKGDDEDYDGEAAMEAAVCPVVAAEAEGCGVEEATAGAPNAESSNPLAGFILPLSTGQSLQRCEVSSWSRLI